MSHKNKLKLPPAWFLRKLIDYNPETGEMHWRARNEQKFDKRHAGEPALRSKTHGYFSGKIFGQTYQAHRVAWKIVHGEDPDIIDHINRVRSDNRIANLRSVTQRENCYNTPKSNRGIRKLFNRFVVETTIAGERIPARRFSTFCDALRARQADEKRKDAKTPIQDRSPKSPRASAE